MSTVTQHLNQMSIRQAARWAERNNSLYRVQDGRPDYMAAAVDVNTNMVLCMGYGDKAYDFKRARPEQPIRVYTLDEVVQGMDEEEGEAACIPGPREVDSPRH